MLVSLLSILPPLSVATSAQLLAGVALICNIASFQRRDRNQILLLFVGATVALGVHFLLLKQMTAAVMMFLAALRYFTAMLTRSQTWIWLFIALAIICGALTYERPVNILTIVGSSFGTWGSFQRDDKKLRLWMMAGSTSWIMHNWLVWSPVALVIELLFFASNVLGFYRFYLKRMHW